MTDEDDKIVKIRRIKDRSPVIEPGSPTADYSDLISKEDFMKYFYGKACHYNDILRFALLRSSQRNEKLLEMIHSSVEYYGNLED